MQTRRLRLGDVVDDYCPRERRLSNHVIVAMVDDAIKQTRCTTCDFEHPYKEGKLPARRKKKDATAALYQQVLDGMTEKPPAAPVLVEDTADEPPSPVTSASASAPLPSAPAHLRSRTRTRAAAATAAAAETPPPAADVSTSSSDDVSRAAAPASDNSASEDVTASSSSDADAPASENEPLHRRTLIRATLPRPVGEVPTRQAPTFTIREAARAPKFRRPFARNARPQGGQNGVAGGPTGRPGARGPQPRGKKGAGSPQFGAQRFGQGHGGHGHGHGSGGGHQHHAKGRQGNQGNKRFK